MRTSLSVQGFLEDVFLWKLNMIVGGGVVVRAVQAGFFLEGGGEVASFRLWIQHGGD